MLHIPGVCPHCARECGFDILCADYYSSQKTIAELRKNQWSCPVFGMEESKNMATVYCGGVCAECHKPVMLCLEVDNANLKHLRECVRDPEKRYNGNTPKIASMAPPPRQAWTHPSLPPEVGRAFSDLQRMVWSETTPAFILIGARTVLEKVCSELGANGKTLFERVKDLREKGILAGVLYEWASEIRRWGNAGTHNFEGSKEDAEDLTEFTKLLLQYAFELPARVKEAREKRKVSG
ncbi:MAG: DUF4145 domain-containing protein [Desulfovibrio sp.]|nr:DUF4145 domain-containing protein [Desulfovibrio sp.]